MNKINGFKKEQSDWHPADIKCLLEKKGFTLAKLSQQNGYSRHAAPIALYKPWPAMEAIIAAAIGVPARLIWPSRYDIYGQSNRKAGRPTGRPAFQRQ
mgnify:FL=1